MKMVKKKRHFNFLNYINAERKCMMFGGYYPVMEKKSKILHRLSAVSFMAIVTLYNLLGLIHGFQHVTNVTVFSELIAFLLTGISYTCKIVNVVFHKRNFELLDELLQNPAVTELETEEEELLVKDKLRFGQKLKRVYRVYVATTITTQMLYPLINNAGQKNFPILLWFPFNAEDHYYKIYCLEVLMIICCCFFNVTVDLLTVLFMDLCAVQFELLKHRLMLVGSPLSVEQEIDEELTFQKLRKIIVHQNHVYSFSEMVEETFSWGVFCQLACTVMVLCFSIFKAVVTPIRSMQFLMMATYSFCMTLEISLYCCYGQKVLDSSSTVTEACFMSKWYNCSVRIQKHLVIIMNRANQSVTMRAGGMFPLTLETLMSIWSSAYSFLTLLMQVYDEGDN